MTQNEIAILLEHRITEAANNAHRAKETYGGSSSSFLYWSARVDELQATKLFLCRKGRYGAARRDAIISGQVKATLWSHQKQSA